MHDTNAFVRSKVLQIWLNIVTEKVNIICFVFLIRKNLLVQFPLFFVRNVSSFNVI